MSPDINHIEETMIMPINKMIRKNPNSDSFSRMAKNERWVTRNIESPIASGQRIIEEIERDRAKTRVFLA